MGAHRVLPVGYAPAWSPNGERIAYVTRGNLWIADADGTHRGLLELGADNPSWSPNGSKLAFVSQLSAVGQYAIFTMNLDGSAVTQISLGRYMDVLPAWSRK